MIINGVDERFITMTIDGAQAKLLVAFLRQAGNLGSTVVSSLIRASEQANMHGFTYTADNVLTACKSFTDTLGHVVDQYRRIEDTPKGEAQQDGTTPIREDNTPTVIH